MTGNVQIKQNQKSEFYMLGPKIELIWTDTLKNILQEKPEINCF